MPSNANNDSLKNPAPEEPQDKGMGGELPGSAPEGTTEAILKGIENRNVESTMEEYFLKPHQR